MGLGPHRGLRILQQQSDQRYSASYGQAGDARRLVGAVAGAIVPKNVRRYAQKKGLYVLEQSGESVEIAEAPEGFPPQEW
jgi:hypothetical protein